MLCIYNYNYAYAAILSPGNTFYLLTIMHYQCVEFDLVKLLLACAKMHSFKDSMHRGSNAVATEIAVIFHTLYHCVHTHVVPCFNILVLYLLQSVYSCDILVN